MEFLRTWLQGSAHQSIFFLLAFLSQHVSQAARTVVVPGVLYVYIANGGFRYIDHSDLALDHLLLLNAIPLKLETESLA